MYLEPWQRINNVLKERNATGLSSSSGFSTKPTQQNAFSFRAQQGQPQQQQTQQGFFQEIPSGAPLTPQQWLWTGGAGGGWSPKDEQSAAILQRWLQQQGGGAGAGGAGIDIWGDWQEPQASAYPSTWFG